MLKKFKIMIAFVTLSISLCLTSSTYSRYIADATGEVNTQIAKWQIIVNNNDITNSSSTNITFTPVIEENENVANNYIAPSSVGYFDIEINPSNVDVSFEYTISLDIANENMPDLMITKYYIIPNDYIEGDPLEEYSLLNNTITNTVNVDNSSEDTTFDPFTIRIYFKWYEGESESMDDEDDTSVGLDAASNNTTFSISASISFQQLV